MCSAKRGDRRSWSLIPLNTYPSRSIRRLPAASTAGYSHTLNSAEAAPSSPADSPGPGADPHPALAQPTSATEITLHDDMILPEGCMTLSSRLPSLITALFANQDHSH